MRSRPVSKTPLTARGAEQLREELKQLKQVERPKVVEAIATARAHGDLKENAEYHAAKDQQGLMEARIRDIEAKLSNAQIIDVTQLSPSGRVVFGATVDLIDVDDGSEARYRIVGEDEADIKSGLLSIGSPMARALIGKQEGDTVEVTTPSGSRSYEIAGVEYI
jgi:transcription elongation factor GreA